MLPNLKKAERFHSLSSLSVSCGARPRLPSALILNEISLPFVLFDLLLGIRSRWDGTACRKKSDEGGGFSVLEGQQAQGKLGERRPGLDVGRSSRPEGVQLHGHR